MVRHAHLALIIGLVIALVVVVFPMNLMAQSPEINLADSIQSISSGIGETADNGQNISLQATGLKEPTAVEREWVNKNFPVIQKIRPNSLALERMNFERETKGLNKLSENELEIAFAGNEAVFNGDSLSGPLSSATNAVLAVVPSSVDNSKSPAFPPIRSQGGIGSCAAWATTYYQFTYETNLARGTTASTGNNANIFSPKWTYNMINGGVDGGSYFSAAYAVEMKNGAATWADFPYDSNYLAWPLDAATWRHAINYRPLSWSQISNSNVDLLISDLKTQLANGHLVVIATYVSSWIQKTLGNDPSTGEDDAFLNQKIAGYLKNTNQGGHAMTMVGYNDSLWCDLNGNGLVDSGEKGAFKIANSWGTGDWNGGYRWVSYDALRTTSAAPSSGTWPTLDRASGGIFWSGNYFTLTARANYSPTMLAEVTLNHAARGQMSLSLGTSNTLTTSPTSSWTSGSVNYSGGARAFNGTSTAVDGTFVFDYSELAPASNSIQRWFVGINDSTAGNTATIKSFKLYQAGSSGDTQVANCTAMPQSTDAARTYSWINYPAGSTNSPPVAVASASPTTGNIPLTVNFNGSASSDPDGSIVAYNWSFGDSSSGSGAQVSHVYTTANTFNATLTVTDDKGATGSTSLFIRTTVPMNLPPVAVVTASPTSGTIPLTVSFNGAASSDPDGSIVAYDWSFGDSYKGTGSQVSHIYTAAKTFTATLTVTDDKGAKGSTSLFIRTTVPRNLPPVAVVTASPTSGTIPLTVSFNGAASNDPDGSIVAYNWSFGDSSKGTGSQVSHVYTTAKTFTATLTVTDNKGARASTRLVINAINPSIIKAPTSLIPKTITSAVTLTWKDNSSNEEGFYIERSVKLNNGAYTSYVPVSSVGPNVTRLTLNVSAGSYKYRIRAFNTTTANFSAYSNIVTVNVK